MADTTLNTTILNPDVYLNHLSPEEGVQFEIARSWYLVVFGASVWDILVYIPDDIKIVWGRPFKPVIFAFIFSRLFATVYVFICVVEKTMPIPNPRGIFLAAAVNCVLAVSTSTFLFLIRVQAIYSSQPLTKKFFFILWLITCGFQITVPLGVYPTFIPGTRYYRDSEFKKFVWVSAFSAILFDTTVFLAISWKVVSMNMNLVPEIYNGGGGGGGGGDGSDGGGGGDGSDGVRSRPSSGGGGVPVPSCGRLVGRMRWRTLIDGRTLPTLSKAVLQGGQQYYLITIGFSILLGAFIGIPSTPPTYKVMFTVPGIPLMASMACRVFRNVRQLDEKKRSELAVLSTLQFRSPGVGVNVGVGANGGNDTTRDLDLESSRVQTAVGRGH